MRTLLILRGLPGAGKSTLTDTLKELIGSNAESISLDDYINKFGFHQSMMKEWHQDCRDRCEDLMGIEHPFIICHNVNAQSWQYSDFMALAEQYNYKCFVVIVENHENHTSVHNLSREDIEKMRAKFKVIL